MQNPITLQKPAYSTKRHTAAVMIGSIFFAFAITFGTLFDLSSSDLLLGGIIKKHPNSILLLFFFSLMALLLILDRLFRYINSKTLYSKETEQDIAANSKTWIIYTGIILVLWIPYFLIFFPGIIADTDYFWQLMQGCGALPLSNHHPVFGSFVFAVLYKIGYAFGGAAGGVFFSSVFQVALFSILMGYSLSILRNMGVSKKAIVLLLIFVVLCPVYPTHAFWLVKDSIFSSIAFFFFFSFFLHLYGKKHHIRVPRCASLPSLILMGFLFSIYRNGTTVIACILVLIASFYHSDKTKKIRSILKLATPLIVLVFLVFLWGQFLKSLNVYPSNFREAVGIPSRQLLKCYEIHKQDLTPEELEALEIIYAENIENGISLDDLAKGNNYRIADYIKPSWFKDTNSIINYIRYWIHMGLKYPTIYLSEALKGTYAYWWIGYAPEDVYHATPCGLIEVYFKNYEVKTKPLKDYFPPIPKSVTDQKLLNMTLDTHLKSFPLLFDFINLQSAHGSWIHALQNCFNLITRLPIISIITVPALYTWLHIVCLLYLSSQKKTGRWLWPVLLIVILACLSPVNGYMRYILPTLFFTPVLIGICLIPEKKINK